MRQWHRWVGICFAAFLLLIGATGVAIQVLDIAQTKTKSSVVSPKPAPVADGDGVTGDSHKDHKHRDSVAGSVAQPDTQAADAQRPKQPQSPLRQWSHWIKDLHSGVLFGPIGLFISILSGLALSFFAVSGVWMYWQMFTRRKSAGRTSFFWKR